MSLATSTRKDGQQAAAAGDEPPSRTPGASARCAQASHGFMLAPVIAILAVLVGYQLYRLIVVSFQEYGRAQVFGQPAPFVGLDNYRSILTDPAFWKVFGRSVALLPGQRRAHDGGRNAGRDLADQGQPVLPAADLDRVAGRLGDASLTAIVIWGWMFDTQFGVVNCIAHPADSLGLHGPLVADQPAVVLPRGHGRDRGLAVRCRSSLSRVYAGLTQVPEDVLEAAELDGASGLQRFRHHVRRTCGRSSSSSPSCRSSGTSGSSPRSTPCRASAASARKTSTLGAYIYQTSIGSGDFGEGGAMAVILVIVMLGIAFWYVNSSIKADES